MTIGGTTPNTKPTTEVDANIIRLLADIKQEVQNIRSEGQARGALLEGAIEEINERLGSFEDRMSQFEEMIRRVAANRQTLINEFKRLKARVDIHQREIEELKEAHIEKQRAMSDHDLKHYTDISAAIVHVGKLEKVMKMTIQFKKDPMVVIPAFLLILVVFLFVWFNKISWEIGVGFVLTGGLMPAILGRKNKKVDEK